MGVRIPLLVLNFQKMSLLDSEENICHEAEMSLDITHAYLIEVMGFSWRRNFQSKIDTYEKEFLGDSKIEIKHSYQCLSRMWLLRYNLPNKPLLKGPEIAYKVRDIYKVYKHIREAFLNMHGV